jgi:hypothetical protein
MCPAAQRATRKRRPHVSLPELAAEISELLRWLLDDE